jgi:predicted RND superfamily exporter protein
VSLLPVALTFLFMSIFNYSINIATVMTFSISLGLLGDSSFHIIYGKTMRFKNFGEYHRGVLSPVIGTGLLLFLSFGIFTFNSFLPIKQFGGILSFIMIMGAIVDLYVLPTLLYKSHWHKKSYESH